MHSSWDFLSLAASLSLLDSSLSLSLCSWTVRLTSLSRMVWLALTCMTLTSCSSRVLMASLRLTSLLSFWASCPLSFAMVISMILVEDLALSLSTSSLNLCRPSEATLASCASLVRVISCFDSACSS